MECFAANVMSTSTSTADKRFLSAKAIMGTLGLWSSRVGMPGVAGSIAARRAHNLSASTSCRASLVIVGAAADGGS